MISYTVSGHGPPVILLHGSLIADPFGGWDKLLVKDFTVYCPHLPGFGDSPSVPGRLHNTDLFADSLIQFIRQQKLANCPLIAFSLGAIVALKTNNSPLILVGLPVVINDPVLKFLSFIPFPLKRFIVSTSFGRRHFLVPLVHQITGNKKPSSANTLRQVSATHPKSLADLNPYSEINLQTPHLLQKNKNKTYFIYGQNDRLLTSAKKFIKDSIIIPASGHNCFVDNPGQTLSQIKKILLSFYG